MVYSNSWREEGGPEREGKGERDMRKEGREGGRRRAGTQQHLGLAMGDFLDLFVDSSGF